MPIAMNDQKTVRLYLQEGHVYIERFERTEGADFDSLEMPMFSCTVCESAAPDMGLAPGGLMRQKIYEDKYGIDAWDLNSGLRCFIHLANSEQYQTITGYLPPHKPPTADDYTSAGLPWFDYYDDGKALSGSDTLRKLTSVAAKVIEKGNGLLPDNEPVQPKLLR